MTILFILLIIWLFKKEWKRKDRIKSEDSLKALVQREREAQAENERLHQQLVQGTRHGSDEALARRLKYSPRANGERERNYTPFNDFFRKEVKNNE